MNAVNSQGEYITSDWAVVRDGKVIRSGMTEGEAEHWQEVYYGKAAEDGDYETARSYKVRRMN